MTTFDVIVDEVETTSAARPTGVRTLVRTRFGRLVLVAIFTALIAGLKMSCWWAIGLVLAATSLFPQQRKAILVVAAAAFAFLMPPVNLPLLRELAPARAANAGGATLWTVTAVAILSTWAMAFAYLFVIHRFPRSVVARRPVTGLLVLLLALVAATSAPLTGTAWLLVAAVTMAFAQYVWFFAYWVSENLTRDKSKPVIRTGFWRPFWGFTAVPYGKGAAYLERVEAKNDEDLATCQIKGLRLLLWGIALTVLIVLINKLVYRIPPGASLTKLPDPGLILANPLIPTYAMSLEAMQAGTPYPLPVRWAALIGYFVMRVAALTVWGAKVIAIARMAGFNAFRNTYRPFEAPTIAEFYNRIYYYFNELLVAFFFYPTYLRYFKKHPRVRLFVATLAAAGLGNWLFHFLRDQELIFRHGFVSALAMYRSYAVYALILGVAIGVSQLRSIKNKGKHPHGVRRVGAVVVVVVFYLLISTFEEPNGRFGLRDYANYCFRLFVP